MAPKPIAYTNSAANPVRKPKKAIPFPLNIYQSAIGKKWVMAVTGIMLLGFVISHMIGNLKLYIGLVEHHGEIDYDVDIYGEFLKELFVPILPHSCNCATHPLCLFINQNEHKLKRCLQL